MAYRVRSWYRWHWLTWLVGVAVVGGLLARQLEKQNVFGITNLGVLNMWSDFGWPLSFLHLAESQGGISVEPVADYEWHPWRMVFNGLFCVLLTIAAVLATERWARRERRLQFGLVEILAATAMTGGLVALGREWELPYRDFDIESVSVYWSVVSLNDLMQPMRWPSVFALACAIYLAAWLLLHVVAWRTSARLGH